MRGGDEDSVHETPISELAEEVGKLREGRALTIAEFGTAGVVIWEVCRAWNGTLHASYWPAEPYPFADDALSDHEIDRIVQADAASRLLLVRGSPDMPGAAAFERLCSAHPQAPAFRLAVPLSGVLRQVIEDAPLTQWYELVTLLRTSSGELDLAGHLLFTPGAQHGEIKELRIRCEPSDDNGTVFAVVAAQKVGRFQLVSVESAVLEPGSYRVTAELRRPGVVRFHGLPAELRADQRPWREIIATVPATLDRPQHVHLICAVETSGSDNQVVERLSRVEQLIRHASAGTEDLLRISLISYGPHSFDRDTRDEPPAVLAWVANGDEALSILSGLQRRGAAPEGYPFAAQLECVLTQVADRLGDGSGKSVLVTVGSRPPFPPRVDPRTGILPCPHWRSWEGALQRLRSYPVAFGAIHDHSPPRGIWAQLGREAFALVDAVGMESFAARLGLPGSAVVCVPFPLIEPEGR